MKNSTVKFVKETSEKMFVNQFTGMNNSTRYIAVNGNLKGYLPGEDAPYSPLGGISVLKSVMDILIWK